MESIKYNISDLQEMFVKGLLKPDIYSSVDEDGCDVIVRVGSNGFQIDTNQKNGWVRSNEYLYDKDENVWDYSESFENKWNE